MKGAGVLGLAGALLLGAPQASADSQGFDVPGGLTSSFKFRQVVFGLTGQAVETLVGTQRMESWGAGVDASFLTQTSWPSRWGAIAEAGFGALAGGGDGRAALLFSARLDAAGQYTFPVGTTHGPFLALGFRFETFWDFPPGWSWIEIPRMEVGYQYEAADLLVRAAVYGAFLLGGGAIDTYTRGTTVEPDYGGRLLLSARGTSLALYVHHVFDAGDDPGVPVNEAAGSACLFVVRGVQACARASLFRAPALLFRPSEAQWRVWSIEIGVGGTSQVR